MWQLLHQRAQSAGSQLFRVSAFPSVCRLPNQSILGTVLAAALMGGIRVCIGFSSPAVTEDLTVTTRGSKGLFYSVLDGSVHDGRRPWRSGQEAGDKLNRKGPGQDPAPGGTPTVAHFLHPRFHPPVPPLPNSLLQC